MTFSLKGLKTITNYQYEPACGILSLLDISSILAAQRLFKDLVGKKSGFYDNFVSHQLICLPVTSFYDVIILRAST